MPVAELPPERLRARFSKDELDCETSETLGPADTIIGQDRALEALEFGLEMKAKGFNVFAAGLPGTGKNTAVRRYVQSVSEAKPTPPDWCYIANFQNSYEPRALPLPSGRARAFQRDLKSFIGEAQRAVPEALEGEDILSRRESLVRRADEERNAILAGFNEEAAGLGFSVQISRKIGRASCRERV